jgi:Malectin domain
MTVESAESIGLEAQRAELRTVLESKEFTRAPKLAHLLSYLCEKLFAGKANQVKEYSIGLEVFHRGDTFDQDSDSIVRVEANRLRRRLAEYYTGEGASHRLRIAIPVGQYVPKFEPIVQPPSTILQLPNSKPITSVPETGQATRVWFRLRGPRPWWQVSVLVALLLAVGLGLPWLLLGIRKEAPPAAVAVHPTPAPADLQVGPPTGEEIRILAGATRSFVDHAGKLWSADAGFTGGSAIKSSVQHIWRTQDPDFYRTSRQGQFRYDLPLKKGIYELRLHFAETVYGPESTGTGGEGDRIMTVRANGKPLLNRFDVVTDAGASRTADVKIFPEISPASDGVLHLEFTSEDGRQATLSAIEILPGVHERMRPVRVLARQSPYYSNDSNWWSPDNYFEGGELANYTTAVTGTDDPELFETERWGNFTYAIPVSPGKYSVTLFFAVRRGDWDQPSGASDKPAVVHIFNVFCNGKALLQDFDLVREARQGDAVIRRFAALEPNAQGKLLLSFVPVQGYATVTGIEVLPQ